MSIKALSLFSGGLDSLLAIKAVQLQGIEVIALNFQIGFESGDGGEYLKRACDKLGVELRVIDIKKQFIEEVLFAPKYGYGKYLNPCIDCHANMIRYAKSILKKSEASFIITGEVLGQRPKSQRRESLMQVDILSDAKGLILRPLSAKLLKPTIAEESGWIKRDLLYDISGRSRHKQLMLVEEFGIDEYSPPAGGCLLTEDSHSKKIVDIARLGAFKVDDIPLVKNGRYFVLPEGARLIVSRNDRENGELEIQNSEKFSTFELDGVVGPVCVVSKNATNSDKRIALKIALTYSKTDKNRKYKCEIENELIEESSYESKSDFRDYFLLV